MSTALVLTEIYKTPTMNKISASYKTDSTDKIIPSVNLLHPFARKQRKSGLSHQDTPYKEHTLFFMSTALVLTEIYKTPTMDKISASY
ncbi:hypothetical protein [Bartonella sp. CL436QHHD]|uniref:hypothetical protein n=1 Tax=Bartonella sp. CL436QHHD TaxID=3243531 RepID=UPI0035CF87C6